MRDRFVFRSMLEKRSSEALLFLVDDVKSGSVALFKLYSFGVSLKAGALKILAGLPEMHVVRLFASGVVEETGQWFEVQEYVAGGSLLDLVDTAGVESGGVKRLEGDVLGAVIAETASALRVFHEAGLVHHDLKPENLLVRTVDPVDVVLADFGLAAVADDEVVFSSRRDATVAYQAPEVLAKQGGRGRDYWALGMTFAQLAAGRHPFEGMLEHAILDHQMHRRPADLSGVPDERVRNLCRGLTRYDVEARWGTEEVSAWLSGDDPVVKPDARAGGGLVGVEFAGGRYSTEEDLARALLGDRREAIKVLSSKASTDYLVGQVRDHLLSYRTGPLLDRWEQTRPTGEQALAELVVTLDPSVPPSCGEFRIDAGSLGGLCRAAVAGDPGAQRAVALLRSEQLLVVYGSVEGSRLADLDRQWRAATDRYAQQEAAARGRGQSLSLTREVANAQLLLMGVEPAEGDRVARDLALAATPDARAQPWFDQIAEATEPGTVLAALQLAPMAAERTELSRLTEAELGEARRVAEAESLITRLKPGVRADRWLTLASVPLLAGAGLLAHWVDPHVPVLRDIAAGAYPDAGDDGEAAWYLITYSLGISWFVLGLLGVGLVMLSGRVRRASPGVIKLWVLPCRIVQVAGAWAALVIGGIPVSLVDELERVGALTSGQASSLSSRTMVLALLVLVGLCGACAGIVRLFWSWAPPRYELNGPEYLAHLPTPPPPAPWVQAGDRAGEPRR